jgi:hypothetical protein
VSRDEENDGVSESREYTYVRLFDIFEPGGFERLAIGAPEWRSNVDRKNVHEDLCLDGSRGCQRPMNMASSRQYGHSRLVLLERRENS